MRTLAKSLLGDNRSSVVLVSQHDDVHVEVPGAPDDDVSDVVLGGLDNLAVHLDPRAGQLVNGVLDDFRSRTSMSSAVGTPLSDPTLISDGLFCLRATCSR